MADVAHLCSRAEPERHESHRVDLTTADAGRRQLRLALMVMRQPEHEPYLRHRIRFAFEALANVASREQAADLADRIAEHFRKETPSAG